MKTGALAKNDAGVHFPLVDLSVEELAYDKTQKNSCSPYHLRSVIIHHGLGLRKGHYSCMAYSSQKDEW